MWPMLVPSVRTEVTGPSTKFGRIVTCAGKSVNIDLAEGFCTALSNASSRTGAR